MAACRTSDRPSPFTATVCLFNSFNLLSFNCLFIENNNFVSGLYQLCCYSNCVWCDKAHVVSLRGKSGRGELVLEGSTPTFAYCKMLRYSSRCHLAEKKLLLSLEDQQYDTCRVGFHNKDDWHWFCRSELDWKSLNNFMLLIYFIKSTDN